MPAVRGRSLAGKSVALIFEKPSTRTRCAFTVACVDEGAHPEYLGKGDIQLGKKETVADTARVLGRMFDGIQFRGFAHRTVEELAAHAGVPVWNGLTDAWHPTQILADVLTVRGGVRPAPGASALAYVGDGRNNVARSTLVGGAKLGMDVRVVGARARCFPSPSWSATVRAIAAETGGKVTVTDSVEEGVRGAHAIYTDVWASMGEEDKIAERIALLKPYKVTRRMMELTGRPEAIFLHCLPALPQPRDRPGAAVPGDLRGRGRGLRGPAVASVRRGREPPPHHQGGHGRDPRRLTADRKRLPRRSLGGRRT